MIWQMSTHLWSDDILCNLSLKLILVRYRISLQAPVFYWSWKLLRYVSWILIFTQTMPYTSYIQSMLYWGMFPGYWFSPRLCHTHHTFKACSIEVCFMDIDFHPDYAIHIIHLKHAGLEKHLQYIALNSNFWRFPDSTTWTNVQQLWMLYSCKWQLFSRVLLSAYSLTLHFWMGLCKTEFNTSQACFFMMTW